MWTYILIWLAIGYAIALINNHIYSIIQPKELQYEENPSMIIALTVWMIFWPIGLFACVRMLTVMYKQNN